MRKNYSFPRAPRYQRGMALISVLAVLFLLTLLVVAFMARTTGARATAANYRATASTAAMADVAVNLVQAQINEATTSGLASNGTLTGTAGYTWGSQPGAIRVYDGTGNLSSIYRLYSATPTTASTSRVISPIGAGTAGQYAALAALNADLPATSAAGSSGWNSMAAQWCDLNAYSKDTEGKYHFPILDPRDPAADMTADPAIVAPLWLPTTTPTPPFKGLQGFYINPPSTVGNTANPAAMPVRWLYVLKDGAIVSPDSPATPSNQLAFTGAVDVNNSSDSPSATNPIVGRVAYWTDDETSKININTAAGDDVLRPGTGTFTYTIGGTPYTQNIGKNIFPSQSTYWATPMFSTQDDTKLAAIQPVNMEIQRYPGHPGTVGLNAELSALMGLATPMPDADFFSLTPRYTWGGSQSATKDVKFDGTNPPGLTLTANRLYTSVGEMLFRATSTGSVRDQSAVVTDAPSASTRIAAAAVERANFFLTAHSAAPELNLYGEPRISIWPYTDKPGGQTPIDQLIAFDSTVRGNDGTTDTYYFTRKDPASATTDCTIPNNVNIFNYLDGLTGGGATPLAIPGFGTNFAVKKYPTKADGSGTQMHQIIAEIFDYVRTIDMVDPILAGQDATGKYTYGQPWGNTGLSIANPGASGAGGSYQVTPSANPGNGGLNGWHVQGIGAYPIPIEVTLDFAALGLGAKANLGGKNVPKPTPIPYQQYKWGASQSPPYLAHDTDTAAWSCDNITDTTSGSTSNGTPAPLSTAIQAFLYVTFLNPGVIETQSQPVFAFSVTFTTPLKVQPFVDSQFANPDVSISPANKSGGPSSIGYPSTNPITLIFPGQYGMVNGGLNAASGAKPELFTTIDTTGTAGYVNGWIGDWIWGYISYNGETGLNNYGSQPGMLLPPPKQWQTTQPSGNPALTFLDGSGSISDYHAYPLYSQIFGLPGQGGGPTAKASFSAATGNPNVNGVFGLNKGTMQIKMYDFSKQGDKFNTNLNSHLVATYNVSFPASGSRSVSYTPYNPNAAANLPAVSETIPTMWLPTYGGESHIIGTDPNGGAYGSGTDRWHYNLAANSGTNFTSNHISPNDTVQSVVLSSGAWADARMLGQGGADVGGLPDVAWTGHPLYSDSGTYSGTAGGPGNLAHNLSASLGNYYVGNTNSVYWGRLVDSAVYGNGGGTSWPIVPPTVSGSAGATSKGAWTTTGAPGDWDNGIAYYPDGPWVNMADEGALQTSQNQALAIAYYGTGNQGYRPTVAQTFSPNREIPSPGMLGSLPTGIDAVSPKPWQTLLFRPGSGAGGFGKNHPGEKDQPNPGDPPDHLLLDLFWMPQAEPYPISQPFVTDGKINLNYEIQPFTYITRNTALRALLNSEEIPVMPDSLAGGAWQTKGSYKVTAVATGAWGAVTPAQLSSATGNQDVSGNSRLPIDPDQTLGLNPAAGTDPHTPTSGNKTTDTAQTGANAWYDATAGTTGTGVTRFFRSPTEICDMFLVPMNYDWKEFTGSGSLTQHSWYQTPNGDFALIGDNLRERPYTDLLSRVTTKSNTYTVYYTVQSLKNSNSDPSRWDETKGAITGEYRGATTIERYLDPTEKYPNFLNTTTVTPGSVSLETYYKWRVLSTRQFAP